MIMAVPGECCRACVLVIDPTSALVGEMYQDEMREVETSGDLLRRVTSPGPLAGGPLAG
jgi:hypothetical protein